MTCPVRAFRKPAFVLGLFIIRPIQQFVQFFDQRSIFVTGLVDAELQAILITRPQSAKCWSTARQPVFLQGRHYEPVTVLRLGRTQSCRGKWQV